LFEGIFETILDLIPPKIRKVIGIILIIIGSIFTLLIAILFLVAGPTNSAGGAGMGVVVFAMMAILSFLIGFKMTFYE
jgi:hypothetical protein